MAIIKKLKSVPKKATRLEHDRPFAPQIAAKADGLIAKYQVVIRFDSADGGFNGRGVELPNAVGFGKTANACVRETFGNMRAIVGYMLECGETPPLLGDPQRNIQLNIRVAEYEKHTIETYAHAAGLGVSDYMRRAALGAAPAH